MALRDLTPQLRTRLNRMERAVGMFLSVAVLLLLAGFAYYIYNRAESKGWFLTKILYSTGLNNAAGLHPGDPVKLMGFNVGEITEIQPNEPEKYYGVTVYFRIKDPHFGYIWLDSKVRVAPSDFLGNRYLEIVKGKYFEPTERTNAKGDFLVLNAQITKDAFNTFTDEAMAAYLQAANEAHEETNINQHMVLSDATNRLNAAIASQQALYYTNAARAKAYWIEPLESPALADRLEGLANAVEAALPNFLNLTNQISGVLTNANGVETNLNSLLSQAKPIVANLTTISALLTNGQGALGEYLIPTNLNAQLQRTLQAAQVTLVAATNTLRNTDTNLTAVAVDLDRALIDLAGITSNLNAQVHANTNILTGLSETVIHYDEFVQGLKKHWLLRSAFKEKKTNTMSRSTVVPLPSPSRR